MNTDTYETEEKPEFASRRDVLSWDSEIEAFEYALKVVRQKTGKKAKHVAHELRCAPSNLTKIRQEMSGFPKESSKAITEVTKSYALQQYRNHLHGFVTKTLEQEEADKKRLQALRAENERLERELREAEDEFLRLRDELCE